MAHRRTAITTLDEMHQRWIELRRKLNREAIALDGKVFGMSYSGLDAEEYGVLESIFRPVHGEECYALKDAANYLREHRIHGSQFRHKRASVNEHGRQTNRKT